MKTGRHTFYFCVLAQVEEVQKLFLVLRPAQYYQQYNIPQLLQNPEKYLRFYPISFYQWNVDELN